MKRLLITLLGLFSLTLSMSAADNGRFKYSYPDASEEKPYNLGYQYSVYDLKESDIEGWRVMYLNEPVTLTYNIISEEDQTAEVVFDPSYMELLDIVIPDKAIDPDTKKEYTVTTIGRMAFDDCPKIRSVIMSDSIIRIEDYAFNMCENKVLHDIGYVRFSKNLTHIGNYAFRNCHNLTTGYYTEGNQWPLQEAAGLENLEDPVYGYGGRQSGLDNYLLLPASVSYIGKHAFEGCYFMKIVEEKGHFVYGLTKVKIPNPSCVIDDYAFAGCQFLELITIGEELTADGLKIPNPTTVKKGRIGDYAFADCNLMRLDIPSSIESIGENAFSNCFHRKRDKTPRNNDGRIFLDNVKWLYPRSLFNNWDSWWANWNNSTFNETHGEESENKTNAYLDRWHTNTITIHSDNTYIGLNAFANNPLLEHVVINGTPGEIGSGAFRNCTNLKSVELPEGLSKVSGSTFMNDIALVEIKIPKDVTEIGDSAFYKCEKLKTLELPSNLTKVNPYTFYGCEELSVTTLPGEVSSIGNHAFFGCKEITTLTIPDKVTTIGEYAFADCYAHEYKRSNEGDYLRYGLTYVKISDGVQTIGAHAFDGCRHLGTIEMDKNVREIGDYAFQNCMSCPEDNCEAANNALTLPDSLTKMGTGVFQGCKNLPAITLGKDMTELPDFAFAYCSNLSYIGNIVNIESAKDNTFLGCYSLADFGDLYADKGNLKDGIIYNDDHTEVISALPNVTVVDLSETKVTKICDDAFANCGALQSVSFPKTLKEIGSRAFENCTSLQSADLINVKMGEFVYAGCTGIETVTIAEDFTQDLQDNWFAGCICMSVIEVEGDNEKYSSYQYDYGVLLNKEEDTLLRAPSGIEYLDLPESVTKIGDYACSNCINLYEVEIPPTVTHIGAHAFDGCYMEEVGNRGNLNYWGLQNLYVYNPAVTIDEYAFNNCKLLEEIYWDGEAEPGAMGSIGAFAFNNCEKLIFSREYLTYAVIDSIKPYAFANFPGINDIELPETLVTIGDHAFENCENLTSVVFPESLKKIGNSAFKSSGLTAIYLPDAIEEIGDSAFMDCSKVMALTLPENLTRINPYTFYKCFSGAEFDGNPLDEATSEQSEPKFNLAIKIPDSVESIGEYAFYGGAVNSNKWHKNESAISNIYHYYNYGLSGVSIGENVKTIGAHAFDGCFHLFEVKMGKAVTSIGDYAFNDCFQQAFNGCREVLVYVYGKYEKPLYEFPVVWELEATTPQEIVLPEGLKSLGVGAFSGCEELPAINFPGSLTAIPDQAFNGCKKISEINLPEGIRSIGDVAFGGCKSVTKISIPASLEEGSRVFVDCDSAFNVTYHAEMPKAFNEAFFSPKVYSSKEAVINTPNALLENVKGLTPWALFHKIVAKDDILEHLEQVLEEKDGLRFRVLANKPIPYCEVAGPAKEATGPTSYVVPEYVENIDPNSEYYGQSYKVIRIGNDAFENDLTLVGITIRENVFDIGQEAFNGCKNLLEINLPNSITNMGERAFANCYGLTYFEVPPLVTRLNPGVLKDCRGLYSIKMHDNIEELCSESLMDCRHLRQFERSQNWKLKLIDDYALKNCIELEEINIPEGVTKIGKEAMYYCQKLNTVSLPTTLQQLGEQTFDDCEVLHTIKVYTETPPEAIGERHLTDQNCKIYVQAKCLDAYKDFWKVHEHRIEPGILIKQPEDMPEYIPDTDYKLTVEMPLDGQTMTWASYNNVVAKEHESHDGTMVLNAVGHAQIHVKTDHKYYHDYILAVYPQLADANWDGRFDISDAVNIATYVVQNKQVLNNWWETFRSDMEDENEWNEFYYRGADVNSDGTISVADASAAVKIILNSPAQSSPSALPASKASSENPADALVVSLTPLTTTGGVSFPVGLENSVEYVAIQADVWVPEGMILKDIYAGPGAEGHTLTTRRIDDRTMRIVIFDLNSSAFASSGEPLFYLTIEGDSVSADDIKLSAIFASDAASNSFELISRIGWLHSGVGSVSVGDFSVSASGEGIIIGNAAGKTVSICTTDGKVISSFVTDSDSENVSLPKGIYIVSVDGNAIKIVVN